MPVILTCMEASEGLDGYVSIEVPPTIAHDTKLRLKPDAIIKEIGRENDDQNPSTRQACLQSSR